MAIHFQVNGQKLSPSSDVFMASKTLGYPELVFDFSSDWNGYSKVATFCTSNSELYYMAISNNKCTVPAEVMEDNELVTVGVYGTKGNVRITTNVVDLPCYKSGYGQAYAPVAKSLDLTSQIYNLLTQTTENLLALEQKGYPLASIKSAVADWGENNASAFISSGSITKDKFADGAVVDPRPNYQQIFSLPLTRIRDGNDNEYPTRLQSMAFIDENTVVTLRIQWQQNCTEAIVLDLTTGTYKVCDLEGTTGHANCAVFVNNDVISNTLYLATGTSIASYKYYPNAEQDSDGKYPGLFVANKEYDTLKYAEETETETNEDKKEHTLDNVWSVCYDSKRKLFYVVGWDSSVSNTHTVFYTGDLDSNLKVMFGYPIFFTNGESSGGVLSYCDDVFYIAKHYPNNIARMDYSGNLIDVAAFPQSYGELEQIAVCGDKLYASSQLLFYSVYLTNAYEISYDHAVGQTEPQHNYYTDKIYVNQKPTNPLTNIKRTGSSAYPYSCIEEALYYAQEPWTHIIEVESNLRAIELNGVDLRINLNGYNIKRLTLSNSTVFLNSGTINAVNDIGEDEEDVYEDGKRSYAVALQSDNCNIVLNNTKPTGSTYDVQGSGRLQTNKAIGNANFSGLITGGGAPATVNAAGYKRSLTNGFIATKVSGKGEVTFDTNRLGDYIILSVYGLQNTKVFVYPISILTSGSTLTRYDTYIYEDTICMAAYRFSPVRDDTAGTFKITIAAKKYLGKDNDGKNILEDFMSDAETVFSPTVLAATF